MVAVVTGEPVHLASNTPVHLASNTAVHIASDAAVRAGDRLAMEVVTVSGRAAEVIVRIRLDSVEIWHHEHLSAVFDRQILRAWLADPWDLLADDEVCFSLDRRSDPRGRIAVSLPHVGLWPLSPNVLASLRDRI
jgi:hypothetical protein